MKAFLFTVVLGQVMLSVFGQAQQPVCQQYTPQQLDTSHCTAAMQDTQALQDMITQLEDAKNNEHSAQFVALELRWIYQYIHCASDTEAIAVLFYGVETNKLPDTNSSFWIVAYHYLASQTTPNNNDPVIVGRRKRQTLVETQALYKTNMNKVIQTADVSCLQWLIGKYQAFGAAQFLSVNTGFPNATHYINSNAPTNSHTTHPRSTTTTTTTPTPTTTTTKPTTTSPTTSTPLLTLVIAAVTEGSLMTHTAAEGGTAVLPHFSLNKTCFVCSGLDCFTVPRSYTLQLCPEDRPICTTHVRDGEYGREIDRGCASVVTCMDWRQTNHVYQECNHIENSTLPWHQTCRYCCNENECNVPPHILNQPNPWPPQ